MLHAGDDTVDDQRNSPTSCGEQLTFLSPKLGRCSQSFHYRGFRITVFTRHVPSMSIADSS